jgi:hypothetical protein
MVTSPGVIKPSAPKTFRRAKREGTTLGSSEELTNNSRKVSRESLTFLVRLYFDLILLLKSICGLLAASNTSLSGNETKEQAKGSGRPGEKGEKRQKKYTKICRNGGTPRKSTSGNSVLGISDIKPSSTMETGTITNPEDLNNSTGWIHVKSKAEKKAEKFEARKKQPANATSPNPKRVTSVQAKETHAGQDMEDVGPIHLKGMSDSDDRHHLENANNEPHGPQDVGDQGNSHREALPANCSDGLGNQSKSVAPLLADESSVICSDKLSDGTYRLPSLKDDFLSYIPAHIRDQAKRESSPFECNSSPYSTLSSVEEVEWDVDGLVADELTPPSSLAVSPTEEVSRICLEEQQVSSKPLVAEEFITTPPASKGLNPQPLVADKANAASTNSEDVAKASVESKQHVAPKTNKSSSLYVPKSDLDWAQEMDDLE